MFMTSLAHAVNLVLWKFMCKLLAGCLVMSTYKLLEVITASVDLLYSYQLCTV